MKLLTISIAAYNVEKFLHQTLDSLVKAKCIDRIQVIVVSDGSTDNTVSIANEYQNRFPKSIEIIDKQNGGHGSTINAGIDVATGKYFMVLDGDDWVDTDELDKLVDLLSIHNEDLILLNSVNQYLNGECKLIIQYPSIKYGIHYDEDYFNEDIQVGLSSALIKSDLLKQSNYRCLEKCFYEDLQYDAYITYLSKSFIYFECSVYQYRLGQPNQSVSLSSYRKNIDMQLRISEAICNFCEIVRKDCKKGKYMSILNCRTSIEKAIVGTYLSYSPNSEIKRKLYSHIKKFKNPELDKMLMKKSKPYKMLKITHSYYITAFLYSKLKK